MATELEDAHVQDGPAPQPPLRVSSLHFDHFKVCGAPTTKTGHFDYFTYLPGGFRPRAPGQRRGAESLHPRCEAPGESEGNGLYVTG